MTKSSDALLGDIAAYAGAAAAAQWLSHLILASDPKLPDNWEQLVLRYTAGSGIVWGACAAYALRHRDATAHDLALLHTGVLAGCGVAVAAMHLADALREKAKARAVDAIYDREDAGHVASPTASQAPLPIPFRARG